MALGDRSRGLPRALRRASAPGAARRSRASFNGLLSRVSLPDGTRTDRQSANGRRIHTRLIMDKRTGQKIYLSPPHMSGEELELVKETFATNWIAPLGPHVDGFENDIAQF